MKKFVLDFTVVVFLLIFPLNAFASYSCETKAIDLVKIQSEIDGLNAQKTTLENWRNNLKNWLTSLVKNQIAITKVEGKSQKYKSEIAELQTQIDGLQFKINELQSTYNELNNTPCDDSCNLSFGEEIFSLVDAGHYDGLSALVSVAPHCSWTATTATGGVRCDGTLYLSWGTGTYGLVCGKWEWEIINSNDWIHLQTTEGVGSGKVVYSTNYENIKCGVGYIIVTASDGQTGYLQIRANGYRSYCY